MLTVLFRWCWLLLLKGIVAIPFGVIAVVWPRIEITAYAVSDNSVDRLVLKTTRTDL